MASKSLSCRSVFLGTFIHSKSLEELEFLHDTAIFVDEKGTIVAIESRCDRKTAEEIVFPKLGWMKGEVMVNIAKPGQFYFPGFIGAPLPSFAQNSADCRQIPIFMLRNTPTQASLATVPSWIGSTPTLSPWKPASPTSAKPKSSTPALSSELSPTVQPRHPITLPSTSPPPTSWRISVSPLVNALSSAAAAWTPYPRISTEMSHPLLP